MEWFAEVTRDTWFAQTGDPKATGLYQYFPNGISYLVGTNWTISPKAYLTASYTRIASDNDNPLMLTEGNYLGQFYTGTFHYQAPDGLEWEVSYAPWKYVDRFLPIAGYSTRTLAVTMKKRF